MVFGVNSPPFLLNAVFRYHIKQYEDIDPEFVECLTNAFFVDDLETSCKDVDAGYSLYVKASVRMSKGGFELRKWKTNIRPYPRGFMKMKMLQIERTFHLIQKVQGRNQLLQSIKRVRFWS